MLHPMAPSRAKIPSWVYRAIGVALLIVVWELVARWVGAYRLPAFFDGVLPRLFPLLQESSILERQGGGSSGLAPHLLHTISFTVLGALLGSGLALAVALLMARFRVVDDVLRLPIDALRTIPPLAAIPFLLIWLGPTLASQLTLLIFYSFVMVVVGTLNALDNMDGLSFRYARTLGASRNRAFFNVIIPGLMPSIVGTLRVMLGVAWGIQVVAEMLAGTRGMGQVFMRMISFQALDVIIVGIIWITVAALLADLVLLAAARKLTRWTPSPA